MELQKNIKFHERYILVKRLSKNSYDEVWLTSDEQMDNVSVALKIYEPLEESCRTEFIHEISNFSGLAHSNLLPIQRLDICEDRLYLVMPYYSKGISDEMSATMDERRIWQFIKDVGEGLFYLHSKHIVHQDIKPSNILINDNGQYVIANYENSKSIRNILRKNSNGVYNVGTMTYMAPELFSEDPAPTIENDIWSLGVILYEIMMGDVPFNGMGGGMMNSGAVVPNISDTYSIELRSLVKRCLAKEKWNRPTAEQLVDIAKRNLQEKSENIGKLKTPIVYDKIGDFKNGLAKVELKDKFGYINQQGIDVVEAIYDYIGDFNEGYAIVILDNKYGYINNKGGLSIPLLYDNALDFSNGYACVKLNSTWWYLDECGNKVIPIGFERANIFINDLAFVKLEGSWFFINKKGDKVSLSYNDALEFSDDLVAVDVDGKWGFVDRQSNLVIFTKYDSVESFSEGLALVKENNAYGFINKAGDTIIPIQYDNAYSFNEDRSVVCLEGKWGAIDNKGNEVIPIKYSTSEKGYKNGIIKFSSRFRKDVYFDIQGNVVDRGSFNVKRFNKIVYWGLIVGGIGIALSFIRGLNLISVILYMSGLGIVTLIWIVQVISIIIDKFINHKFKRQNKKNDEVIKQKIEYKRQNGIKGRLYNTKSILGNFLFMGVMFGGIVLSMLIRYDETPWSLFSDINYISYSCWGTKGYINGIGYEVVPFKYESVEDVSENMVAVKLHNKWGFVDINNGREVIPCIYDDIENSGYFVNQDNEDIYKFKDGLACVKLNGKKGLINTNGESIIPCKYENLHRVNDCILIKLNNKWGALDSTNTQFIPCEYDSIYCQSYRIMGLFKSGHVWNVKSNNKWGILDEYGESMILCKYDDIELISDYNYDRWKVKLNGKYGIINDKDNIILKCQYDSINKVDSLFAVQIKDKIGFMSFDGTCITSCIYDEYEDIEYSVAVRIDDKWGFINDTHIVSCKYDDYGGFSYSDKLCAVEKNGKWGFINEKGEEVIPCTYYRVSYFSDGYACILKRFYSVNEGYVFKWGIIDTQENLIIPCIYDNIDYWSNKRIAVKLDGKWGFVDRDAKEVVSCKYDEVKEFSCGRAAVKLYGRWGFINDYGYEVIPCQYDHVEKFYSDRTYVYLEDKMYIIDINGKKV